MSDLIRREDVTDVIQKWFAFADDEVGYNCLTEYINAIPTIDAVSEWIPCEERLPSENGRYLVFTWLMEDMPWISVMYYGKPTFPETDHPCFYVSDDEYGDVEYDDIVAWMPLPKPYERSDT